ncbi:hypothetical protein ACFSTH_08545 [Paenibacillus yanchengensis]|uniref:Uncharacterized protein n=1 Tax=Paenibacillus yanchengensis TaxID=2035833 RepID=A0ABW4YKX8_9BACL
MTKLDGNERWKGKMLLTEHQEQYDQRQVIKSAAGRPTSEELDMIRDLVVLPHLITMIQKSLEDMAFSKITLKGVVIRCLEVIMFKITDDYYVLKRELKQRNIKVSDEETNDGILYYRYYCRGYEEKFGIVRETLRSDVTLKLTKYTNDIGKLLKQVNKGK